MRLLHGLELIAIAGVAAAVWPSPPTRPHQPCRAVFELVKNDMTYNQVCVLVGGPPGDYSGGRCIPGFAFQGGYPRHCYSWTAVDGTLVVRFTERSGLAYEKRIDPPSLIDDEPASVWKQIRDWLGL